ncbi:flagellar biosynthesis protein FlgA [Cellulomonas sp. DKR-3]|uniref:Flagellar biosynthesis protein FlgA n=1 Tax=Cellulomonas fulva TaxID=2835530 RepID=A0ABS5TUW5_9CELL|nr:flagellar biosynthesis protein FlgA [Cellulomonas fulva]
MDGGRWGPPALARRRRSPRTAWRGWLWRWRFVVAALGVAVTASAVLQELRPEPPRTTRVVVAARDLPAGTTIAAADLRVARVPGELGLAVVTDEPATLVGQATAVPVPAGLPVVPGLLATGDVAGPEGTVVAAVRLADPAVAALLAPGTRVDVLAATPESAGVVVARRALVLPVPAVPDAAGWDVGAGAAEAPPVLVAVTPDEATDLAGAAASSVLSAVVVP